MLEQLRQVISSVVAGSINIQSLAKYGNSPATPLDATNMAVEFCQLAKEQLPVSNENQPMAELAAIDLIEYIANLPDWIQQEINQSNQFRHDIQRAWEEPEAGAYVGLCCTVQDVWEHLLGPESKEDEKILSKIASTATGPILDYGCGAGYFSMALVFRGFQVDCYDLDKIKLDFLRFRANKSNLNDKLVIKKPDSEYQSVIAINVLDHAESPQEMAANLSNWLAPGGHLFLIAEFPDDHWHQSDNALVEMTVNTLFSNLSISEHFDVSVPSLEILTKNIDSQQKILYQKISQSQQLSSVPLLHSGVKLSDDPSNPELVHLSATSFYIAPNYIDRDLVELLSDCDGSRPVSELCEDYDCELEELWPLLAHLWQQRIISISNTFKKTG